MSATALPTLTPPVPAPADPVIALVPYLGPGDTGAAVWLHLSPSDRRRTAMRAARDRDRHALWSLVEAWLRTFGLAGAAVSPATVRSYRTGLHALLDAWVREDLLRPDPDAATAYVRLLQCRGLAPSTIQARLAAGPGLYAALRWCRAVALAPFADCRPPRDQTPPWDKRVPYADDEVAALAQRRRPSRSRIGPAGGARRLAGAGVRRLALVRRASDPTRPTRTPRQGRQAARRRSECDARGGLDGTPQAPGRLRAALSDSGKCVAAPQGGVCGGVGAVQGRACAAAQCGNAPLRRDTRPGGDGTAPRP